MSEIDELRAQLAASREREAELIAAIRASGVEMDDPRLRYVTVQIDRELWDKLAELEAGR